MFYICSKNAVRDKERHNIALTAYKKRVKELEDWLEEQKIRQAITPLPSDSVAELKQSLLDNQVIFKSVIKFGCSRRSGYIFSLDSDLPVCLYVFICLL